MLYLVLIDFAATAVQDQAGRAECMTLKGWLSKRGSNQHEMCVEAEARDCESR